MTPIPTAIAIPVPNDGSAITPIMIRVGTTNPPRMTAAVADGEGFSREGNVGGQLGSDRSPKGSSNTNGDA